MALFSLIAGIASMLHVGQMAEYNYSIVNDKVQLEITLENSEMKALHLSDGCDAKKMTALCVSNYIIENSVLNINGESVHFELTDSHIQDDHLVILLSSKESFESVNSVEIKQATFYEFFGAYRNRVILNLTPFTGSYMLTKDKNSISLTE